MVDQIDNLNNTIVRLTNVEKVLSNKLLIAYQRIGKLEDQLIELARSDETRTRNFLDILNSEATRNHILVDIMETIKKNADLA